MSKNKAKLISIGENFHFTIPERIVPKARPKFGKGGAYMPKHYKDNQNNLISIIKGQFLDFLANHGYDTQGFIMSRCGLEITHHGYARGDADNISGSIMDAMVKAEVIENDNVNNISPLYFEHGGSEDWNETLTTHCKAYSIDLRPIEH